MNKDLIKIIQRETWTNSFVKASTKIKTSSIRLAIAENRSHNQRFSNTSGGRLLIGVRDNGLIAGVKDEDDIYMVENATQIFLHPTIDVEVLVHQVDGKILWEIIIPEGRKKPYKVEETDKMIAYHRIKMKIFSQMRPMEVWRQEQSVKSKRPVEFSDSERKLIDYLKSYSSRHQ